MKVERRSTTAGGREASSGSGDPVVRIVVPGVKIAAAEEYLAGEGTYELGGQIFAEIVGILHVDEREKIVNVRPLKPVPTKLKPGNVIVGMVSHVRNGIAIVEIFHCTDNARAVILDESATLHISKVDGRYHRDFSDVISPGDLVKAKVIRSRPALQIGINGRNLGVIKASCRYCGTTLVRRGRDLHCTTCSRTFRRKVSADYMGRQS